MDSPLFIFLIPFSALTISNKVCKLRFTAVGHIAVITDTKNIHGIRDRSDVCICQPRQPDTGGIHRRIVKVCRLRRFRRKALLRIAQTAVSVGSLFGVELQENRCVPVILITRQNVHFIDLCRKKRTEYIRTAVSRCDERKSGNASIFEGIILLRQRI